MRAHRARAPRDTKIESKADPALDDLRQTQPFTLSLRRGPRCLDAAPLLYVLRQSARGGQRSQSPC